MTTIKVLIQQQYVVFNKQQILIWPAMGCSSLLPGRLLKFYDNYEFVLHCP